MTTGEIVPMSPPATTEPSSKPSGWWTHRPPDERLVAVELRRLMQWIRAFGLLSGDADERMVIDHYAEAMRRLPADLLPVAVTRLQQQWRYHHLPLPADLTATVEADWSAALDAARRERESQRRAAERVRESGQPRADPETISRLMRTFGGLLGETT